MRIFKIEPSMIGEFLIVRPLLNPKNIKNSILTYVVDYQLNPDTLQRSWVYRHLCFALINGELEIFDYSDDISTYITDDILKMKSNKSVRILVGRDNVKCDIITNDGFRFDNTPEKKDYIKNVLGTTSLNLSSALEQQKSQVKDKIVELMDENDFEKTVKKRLSQLMDQQLFL